FHYPLRPVNALVNLGPITAVRGVLSYANARLMPIKPEQRRVERVVNRFGRLLFTIFFKTYTEKVWGMPTSEISADWAAQRIKGLSLTGAILNALFARGTSKKGKGKCKSEVIKTLIDSFQYP